MNQWHGWAYLEGLVHQHSPHPVLELVGEEVGTNFAWVDSMLPSPHSAKKVQRHRYAIGEAQNLRRIRHSNYQTRSRKNRAQNLNNVRRLHKIEPLST